jgi:pyruvate carboxylase subunit B
VPINHEVQKKALKGYPRGEEPITCRPAEVLEPELDKAREEIKDLAKDIDDVLIYALYPVTGKRFLKWKYGLEPVPPEVKPRSMDDVKAEQELLAKAKAGKLVEKKEKSIPVMGENLRKFNVLVDGEYFEVEVEDTGGSARIGAVRPATPRPAPVVRTTSDPTKTGAQTPMEPAAGAVDLSGGTPLIAPMPGMIVGVDKKEGDTVNAGETILILEAMKMENALPAPISGTIRKINLGVGDHVAKNDILCVIEP